MDTYCEKQFTCCFTGHRVIPKAARNAVARGTADTVRSLITEKKVTTFIVGGAIGYDTLAAEILLRIRDEEYPHIRVVLYYPFDGYDSRWTPAQQETGKALLSRYDDVVCTDDENTPVREKYLLRDRRMADASAYCVSYCTRTQGGTAYTIRYALKHGCGVYHLGNPDLFSSI